jgi:hypothetical protein
MDEVLVAAGVAVPLVVALVCAVWCLVANSRRERPRRGSTHVFRGQGEAVTVAELLNDATERGEGIRLNWPEDDLDERGLVRPYAQDQFPTIILPRIEDDQR